MLFSNHMCSLQFKLGWYITAWRAQRWNSLCLENVQMQTNYCVCISRYQVEMHTGGPWLPLYSTTLNSEETVSHDYKRTLNKRKLIWKKGVYFLLLEALLCHTSYLFTHLHWKSAACGISITYWYPMAKWQCKYCIYLDYTVIKTLQTVRF